MKTLYLHIGTPKTATSSIQKFLAENWDVLQKHGYFFPESTHIYPRVNARRNAHFLSGRVRNGEGIRDKEKEKTYLEEGLQQVRDAFQNYDNVILTDESIWYCLCYLKKSLLCDLKKEADKQGYQIKVIVYLRRQDKFLLSRWNQRVKQKSTSDAVLSCDEYFELTQKKEKDIYQYGKILDGIAEVIGKENLIVRRFDVESWRDGSIIHDFMHEIGIDVTPEFHELEKNANLSLDKNTTEIKRILNQEESFTSMNGMDANGTLTNYKRINKNDCIYFLSLGDYKATEQQTRQQIQQDASHISLVLSIDCIYRYLLYEKEGYFSTYAKVEWAIITIASL